MMIDKELDNIRQTYNELDNAVVNLPNRIEEVATGFENEFLTTYRIHIISIQEEMKVLKEKIKIAQEALNDNEVVSKLEDVVHWFRNQADQFQHLHEEMVEEAQTTTERTQELSIKNDELRRQLMVFVKTNKILKMKSLSNLSQVDESSSSSSYANNIEDDSILSFVNNGNNYDRSDNDNDNHYQINNRELEPESNANFSAKSNKSNPNFDNGDDYNKQQSYTQNNSNKNKKSISAARNRSKQILAELNQLRQSRSSTEIVLDDALTQATLKVTQRKQLQSLSSSSSSSSTIVLPTKKSMRSTNNSTDKVRQSSSSLLPSLSSSSHNNNNSNNNNNNSSSGISGYSLKSLTEQDKYEVMVNFLSNPQQFVNVVQRYQEWSAHSREQQQLLLQQKQEDSY